MNIAGVLMECNPPHRGHRYLLEQARKAADAEYCVVVMSGDYVQRGEPALVDKYTRAGILLENGADLVLEMPLYAAAGSAAYFAECGIRLLEKLGAVTHMVFGVGTDRTDLLEKTAALLSSAELGNDRYKNELRRLLSSGTSFPAARAGALLSLCGPEDSEQFKAMEPLLSDPSPNDQLALEYYRVLQGVGSPVVPVPVPRIPGIHASDLRTRILSDAAAAENKKTSPAVSAETLRSAFGADLYSDKEPEILENRFRESGPVSFDDFGDMLLYRLCTEPDLTAFFDVSDALASRMKRLLPQYRDPSGFAMLLKTKNMTYTRIRRALLHILLSIRTEDVMRLTEAGWAGYARVLGVRSDASPLLQLLDDTSSIPLIYRPASDSGKLPSPFREAFERDMTASELYALTAAMRHSPASPFLKESAAASYKETSRRLLRI